MGEDYGYQDPEVEIKESGDVDFVEFTDSIADGKDHSVTFYDIAPEGSVMLVYNYDHAQDKLEVISYDENYTEETLYVREHGDVTAGSIENIKQIQMFVNKITIQVFRKMKLYYQPI